MRALKAVGALVGLGVVALLPLYGDIRPQAAVSHAEWARMMLRGLDLLRDDRGINDTAAQAFATLSGRQSRAWAAPQYVRAEHVEGFRAEGSPRIRPDGGIGEAVYAFGVARGGEYRLRLHVAAPGPAETEFTEAGSDDVIRSFSVPAAVNMGWAEAGTLHLDAGAYEATVLLPEGSQLEFVELAPPCLHPIEPRGGWRNAAISSTEDVAVTLLQALDLESELPPAAPPLEYRGGDLKLEDGSAASVASTAEGGFRGGPRGARVVLVVDIPEDGLYTLSVFGTGPGGQRWLADACRSSLICPNIDPTPRWRDVLSGDFPKGRHYFSASLGPDTVVERVRIEQKKDSSADYVATVARLGLDLGPEGDVTREKAEEARRFLERQRSQRERELCGDILRPGTLVAQLSSSTTGGGETGGGGEPGGGGTPPGGSGPGGGGGGLPPPPIIPPLPPATPFTVIPLS